MLVNVGFIVGVTAGAKRSTVVGIPLKGMDSNIAGIVVTVIIRAAQRTTEKHVFLVSPHHLHNSCEPPSQPSDQPSVQMRHSGTSSTS